MQQPIRKLKEKPKRRETMAQIEFAAPYSLAECLFRLRDTRYQEPGFFSPGIDPSFDKVDDITYQFRIRRTWYDYRYKFYAYVEVRGYLRAFDSGTTIVIGTLYISPLVTLFVALFGVLLAIVILMPIQRGTSPLLVLPFFVVIAVFLATIYFDRRTLLYLLRTTLGADTYG